MTPGRCSNSAEAVDALQQHTYAAVLMDCQRPVMDGDADRCLAAGMDDHLPKPVHREELAQTPRAWLD